MTEFAKFIKEVIAALPSEVWTGLGAVAVWALTTLTNRMSNSHARKMLEIQLDHDSDERQRERRAAMNREVLLPALDAGSHAMTLVSQLIDPEADTNVVNDALVAANQKLIKAAALCSPSTWEAVGRFQNELWQLQADLSFLRRPMMMAHAEGKYAVGQSRIAVAEMEKANADQRHAHAQRGYQAEDVAKVDRAFEAAKLFLESMMVRERDASKAFLKSFLAMLDHLETKYPTLSGLNLEAVAAIRAELGIAVETESRLQVRQRLLEGHQRVVANMRSAYEELHQQLEEKVEKLADA
ncbi:hypothetical protein ACOTF1_26295 [Achromobacter ruhlandii]|uniref:hypothetical protein n=1 Tax=Achromobacter ruhlandii TaxID=72557 RepID=UPI003B9AB678